MKKTLSRALLTAAALFAGWLAVSCGRGASAAQPKGLEKSFIRWPQEKGRITFTVAGDVIPHKPVKEAAAAHQQKTLAPGEPHCHIPVAGEFRISPNLVSCNHDGWDSLFEPIADLFKSSDYGFVNLETPVAPKNSIGSKPFQFDAPTALLAALKSSGINLVSFANNHVYDQRHPGFAETLSNLREAGLLFVGSGDTEAAAWEPVILEKNGLKVGMLGITRWLNGNRNPEKADQPHVAFVPYDDDPLNTPGATTDFALEKIKAARTKCDLLLISIHWGVEYAAEPRKEDIAFAHAMLDAGASMIIGSHPHVLQPIETYITADERHTIILYSLGNFVSNQARNYIQGLTPEKTGEMRDSLIARFAAVKKDYGPGGIKVELADFSILPVWTENNQPRVKGAPAEPPVIQPVLIDRELPKAQAAADELQKLTDATPAQKKDLLKALKRVELLRRRRELLLGRTGDEYLADPPPLPAAPVKE